MTAEPDSELDNLLARLDKEHPAVAERQLQLELDDLLGRETKPKQRTSRRNAPSKQSGNLWDDGSWLQRLFRISPSHLDHECAVEHARNVEAGLYAKHLISNLNPAEATREHLKSLHAISEQGQSSFDYLVLCNLRLVYFWCRRLGRSLDDNWMQDAFQAGCMGLIRGLQGWDYSRGALSTYVSWHIRQQIQRWRMNDFDIIRVPVHVWERFSSTPEDLSKEVLQSAQDAFGIRSISEFTVSELEKVRAASDLEIAYVSGIERVIDEVSLRQILSLLLTLLSDREAGVLLRRHGLGSTTSEPATLQEIGDEFGLSRERIRQIERDALKRLREHASLRSAWAEWRNDSAQ